MLKHQQIIPAIGNYKDLKIFLKSDLTYGILLNFQLAQLPDLVLEMKKNNKKAIIHGELIKGLGSDEYGAIYLVQNLQVDGIISSKPKVIEVCKKRNIIGILRLFLKDSLSLEQGLKIAEKVNPEYLEILPALSPQIIPEIKKSIKCNIMAGGLIRTKEQIKAWLQSGAVGVSTSNSNLWI